MTPLPGRELSFLLQGRVSSDVLVGLTVKTVSILFSQDEISTYCVLG